MRVDISLLPALAAAFMLVFARIGAMVMLLPGLGETNIPVRVKLAIALLLTLIILPLHRSAYHVDMNSMTSLLVLMLQEIIIGVVLGATARVTLAALSVAGSVIAQQLGLGFVTSVDPTQGQQGLLIGNFLTLLGITLLFATDSHHLVIAALNESYRIFRRARRSRPATSQPLPPARSPPRSRSACSLRRRFWCSASSSISGSACWRD